MNRLTASGGEAVEIKGGDVYVSDTFVQILEIIENLLPDTKNQFKN